MIGLIRTVPRMPGREAGFQSFKVYEVKEACSSEHASLASVFTSFTSTRYFRRTLLSGARHRRVLRRWKKTNVRRSGRWRGRHRCCGWARYAIRRNLEREMPEHGKPGHDSRRIRRAMLRKRATARSAAACPIADETMTRARSCSTCCPAIPSCSGQSGSSTSRCCRGPQA